MGAIRSAALRALVSTSPVPLSCPAGLYSNRSVSGVDLEGVGVRGGGGRRGSWSKLPRVVSDQLNFHILGLFYSKHTSEQLYLKSGISRRKPESLYPVVT